MRRGARHDTRRRACTVGESREKQTADPDADMRPAAERSRSDNPLQTCLSHFPRGQAAPRPHRAPLRRPPNAGQITSIRVSCETTEIGLSVPPCVSDVQIYK